MSDYTSLAIGSAWGLIVFSATMFHIRRKERLMRERNQQGKLDFPAAPKETREAELVGQR